MSYLRFYKAILIIILMITSPVIAKTSSPNPQYHNNAILAESEHIARLDRILTFINDLLSRNDKNYIMVDKTKLLSERIFSKEELNEKYNDLILNILKNPSHFKIVNQYIFGDEVWNGAQSKLDQDKIALLVLSIERYARDNNLTLKEQSGDKYKVDFYLVFVPCSALYKFNKNEILLVWCTGRGAHNNGYCLWNISLRNGVFKATQLNIPQYVYNFVGESIVGSKLVDNLYTINSGDIEYDSTSSMLFMKSYDGESKQTYKVSSNKLILIQDTNSVIPK